MKNMKEPESYERIKNKEFFTDVIDSMGNYNLSADDLSQIKHYGEYKEDENSPPRIILIDPGATEDIMRQFYKRK